MTRSIWLTGFLGLTLAACGQDDASTGDTRPDGDAETVSETSTTTDAEVSEATEPSETTVTDSEVTDSEPSEVGETIVPDTVVPTDGGDADDGDTTDTTDVDTAPPPLEPLFSTQWVRDVRIELPAADWDALRKQRRSYLDMFAGDCLADEHVSPFTWFRGSVTVDGVTLGDVGVRKKGWIGSVRADAPSLKLKLDKYIDDQALAGFEDVILNNSVQDMSYQRQCLGYALFAAAGVPAPACGYAHVRVNGEDLGLYVMVEAVDRAFLRARLPDASGTMYEGVFSDFRDGWLGSFEPETNEATADKSELAAVRDALAASDDAVVAALDAVVDVDGFITYWAMELILRHRDGYANHANNFHVYADPSDGGRLRFLPHGIDAIMQPFDGAPSPQALFLAGSALASRLVALPSIRERLFTRLDELLDDVWDADALLAEIDRVEPMLAPHVLAPGQHAAESDVLRTFVSGRKAWIEAVLAASPTPTGELAPSPCLPFIGSFSATFDTKIGTLFGTPPGAGTLTVELGGDMLTMSGVQARAGVSGDTATLNVTGTHDGRSYRLELTLEPSRLTPSTSTVDGLADNTFVYGPTPGGAGSTNLGYGMPATLVLEQAGSAQDAPLRGSISGSIFALSN